MNPEKGIRTQGKQGMTIIAEAAIASDMEATNKSRVRNQTKQRKGANILRHVSIVSHTWQRGRAAGECRVKVLT